MRTRYEIEEHDGYLPARDLLVRRCGAWAQANGRVMSAPLASALLDSRHFSTDGRLGYWTPGQVRRALLDWVPAKVTAGTDDLLPAPETLRSLLRYLDATGLRDPRGASVAENETAIDAAAREFGAAIADTDRYGLAKMMALSTGKGDSGVQVPEKIASLLREVDVQMPDFDADDFEEFLAQAGMSGGPGEERTYAQLPVRLPDPGELAAAAEQSKVVAQFRALLDWLGPKGRALTAAKNITPGDARELITLLGTGDENLTFRSAAELPGLNLIITWALKARLIRRNNGRLVPVAKARPLLADAEALWRRAFDTLFDDLGAAVCRPIWPDEPPTPSQQMYEIIVPDVMATIYSMEEPVPVPRLAESVWELVKLNFDVESPPPMVRMTLRGRTDSDLEHIFDAFEALGALTSVQGMPHEIWSMDLGGADEDLGDAEEPFEPEAADALRERLRQPARLVSLTSLGTRAMRERMLAEGREAPLIGELTGATAAEMLGTVTEHYTDTSGPEEIALWREAHGGALDPLVQAVRECPFLSRRVAMLGVLVHSVPEGPGLFGELSDDPELGPVLLLAQRDELAPGDLSEDEAVSVMSGSLLELTEIGGPEAVARQLEKIPAAERNNVLREVSASGYPAPETLEEFRTLVAEPLLHASVRPHSVPGASARHPRPRRQRRR